MLGWNQASKVLVLSVLAGILPLRSAMAEDVLLQGIEMGPAAPSSGSSLVLTDIGTIADRASIGLAINGAGDVTGSSQFEGIVGDLEGKLALPFLSHAILYSNGILMDLGALEGYAVCSPLGCESAGAGINGSRWIVGKNDGDYGPMAMLWMPGAVPGAVEGWNVLPPLSPTGAARANSINDAGQIVGDAVADGGATRAALWVVQPSGPVVTDLGTLRADGGGYSWAYDVNSLGQIAGVAQDDSGFRKPFLHLPSPAYGLPAGMNDLAPDLEDYVGAAYVNDRGEVACEIDLGVPCLWLPAPAYGFPAGFSLLPLTGHVAAFFPSAISEAGQIAGTVFVVKSDVTGDYDREAAVWRAGQYRLLNEILPSGSPWDLIQANDIVKIGATTLVTGYGIREDVLDINGFPAAHGFVLRVTCTGDLDEDGDVDADDQAILRSFFGQEVPAGTSGDLDGNGVVDETDIRLLAWQIERPCL